MQRVRDPGGQFTIDFPAGWEVEALGGVVRAAAPGAGVLRPIVYVTTLFLAGALSPEALAQQQLALRKRLAGFRTVQEGRILVAGHQAFYRYYTWRPGSGQSLYVADVYVPVGPAGFVITESTVDDPQHIRSDLPVFTRIVQTFHPFPHATGGRRIGAVTG